jgi:hypothetical protein
MVLNKRMGQRFLDGYPGIHIYSENTGRRKVRGGTLAIPVLGTERIAKCDVRREFAA